MPKRKIIITPVLRYWGFERHPFDDYVLENEDLELFVDRKDEVRRLQNALSNPLCGAFGAQGIGKSSVLNQFIGKTHLEGYPVVVAQMTGTSENLLYREILLALLKEIKAGNISVLAKLKLKVDQEIERVNHAISYTTAVEAAGEVGWQAMLNLSAKIGVEKAIQEELPQHTEDSATALIHDIAVHAKSPFVIVIDNLERTRSLLADEDAYFRFITKFARTVDSTFSEVGVAFVVSLDQSFADRIQGQLPGAEEAYSFSFGQLVEIGAFPADNMYEIMVRRIVRRGWKAGAADFITTEAFWALMLATAGHPRRAFAVLREAMELVAAERSPKRLTMGYMKRAASKCRERLDETDIAILRFLSENGPHSPSDREFLEAVGISRPTLTKRLLDIQARNLVTLERQKIGSTTKEIYRAVSLEYCE